MAPDEVPRPDATPMDLLRGLNTPQQILPVVEIAARTISGFLALGHTGVLSHLQETPLPEALEQAHRAEETPSLKAITEEATQAAVEAAQADLESWPGSGAETSASGGSRSPEEKQTFFLNILRTSLEVALEKTFAALGKPLPSPPEKENLLASWMGLFTGLKETGDEEPEEKPSSPPGSLPVLPFTPDRATVTSDPYTQSFARGAWEVASDTLAHWERPNDSWPFYEDPETGCFVFAKEGDYADEVSLQRAWKSVLDLDDAKVTSFLVALAKWTTEADGNPERMARIHVNDILSFIGLQKHHKGGYRKSQKEQAKKDLVSLSNVWVKGMQTVKEGKEWKPVAVEDRLLYVATEHEGDLLGDMTPYAFRIRPGEWVRPYVSVMRFTAQLFRPIFSQLDTHNDSWGIRLGIYLTWQWRMRAHKANWEQPWSVGALLDGARLPQEDRNRERIREQFERALDALQRIEAIANWEYAWPKEEDWEAQLPKRNWFAKWKEWPVSISPPDWVKEQYAEIAPRQLKAIAQQKRAQSAAQGRTAA